MESIMEKFYPSLVRNYINLAYLKQSAIMVPKNDIVNKLNEYIIKFLLGKAIT